MGKSTPRTTQSEGPSPLPQPESPTNGQTTPAVVKDWFADCETMRSDEMASPGTQSERVIIDVRKPGKELYFHAHPDPAFTFPTMLLVLKQTDFYMVIPPLHHLLKRESRFQERHLILCMDERGAPFLWPLTMANRKGKLDTWNESAVRALTKARHEWIRLDPDQDEDTYRIVPAENQDRGEPRWPEGTMPELLRLAFGGTKFIDTEDHPALDRLFGR